MADSPVTYAPRFAAPGYQRDRGYTPSSPQAEDQVAKWFRNNRWFWDPGGQSSQAGYLHAAPVVNAQAAAANAARWAAMGAYYGPPTGVYGPPSTPTATTPAPVATGAAVAPQAPAGVSPVAANYAAGPIGGHWGAVAPAEERVRTSPAYAKTRKLTLAEQIAQLQAKIQGAIDGVKAGTISQDQGEQMVNYWYDKLEPLLGEKEKEEKAAAQGGGTTGFAKPEYGYGDWAQEGYYGPTGLNSPEQYAAWHKEFQTQHPLEGGGYQTPEALYAQTGDSMYQAMDDLSWSLDFLAKTGRGPNEWEWKQHWYQVNYGYTPDFMYPEGQSPQDLEQQAQEQKQQQAQQKAQQKAQASYAPKWFDPTIYWGG